MKRLTAATALLLMLTSGPLWAQAPATDDPHHPSASAAPVPAQPAPQAPQAQPSPPQRPQLLDQLQGGVTTGCPMMSDGKGGTKSCPMMSGQAPGSPMPGMGPSMHEHTGPGMQGGEMLGGSGAPAPR